MFMGYKVLIINESENLQLYLDNIKINRKEDFVLIPIGDLQMVIIDNYKLVLSVQLINKLVENNVSIIYCGMNHLPKANTFALNSYFASSGMMVEQINWKKEIKGKLTQKIIEAKIINQSKILEKNNCNEEVIFKLKQFAREVKVFDSTNREGLASKMYFRELFGKSFIRFNDDTINAGLNYGYSILRSLISTLLVSKGLLPNLGIFHRGKQNSFNLSDDLIEVFRPIIDDYVFNNMYNCEILTYNHRKNMIEITTKKIKIKGKYHSIHNCIIMYIENIIECIKKDSVNDFYYPGVFLKEDV